MSTNITERQAAEYAICDLGIANIGTGNGYTLTVPSGAFVTQVALNTVTAFDSGTTATGSIGDGTTTFVSAQDVKSTGVETVAVVNKFYPDGGTITISLAETGTTATEGRAIGVVGYISLGRGGTIRD
jgi:hypothetical protein